MIKLETRVHAKIHITKFTMATRLGSNFSHVPTIPTAALFFNMLWPMLILIYA